MTAVGSLTEAQRVIRDLGQVRGARIHIGTWEQVDRDHYVAFSDEYFRREVGRGRFVADPFPDGTKRIMVHPDDLQAAHAIREG